MWWDDFKRQLINAFNTYDRLEKISVHSKDMRLRTLNKKILEDLFKQSRHISTWVGQDISNDDI